MKFSFCYFPFNVHVSGSFSIYKCHGWLCEGDFENVCFVYMPNEYLLARKLLLFSTYSAFFAILANDLKWYFSKLKCLKNGNL